MSKKSVLGLVMGWLAAAFVFAACFFLDSCNVGLGESVDTEAPTIKVTYPSNSSTVRGKMVLYGICGDDKGVSNITVSVTDNSTKASVDDKIVNRTATISDTTWRLEIDTTSLTDGNYTFSATAKDDAGHTTSSQGTYDVDNTAPLFIATKPGVYKGQKDSKGADKDPTAYGSTLTVEGKIADSHSISKMVLSVYKTDGTLINTFEQADIATAGGTSVTFANSYKGNEDNYYKIYDATGAETQSFYATVTLYDSAYEYNDPTGQNGGGYSGNSTSTLYLNDDVYSTLLSSADGGLGLTAADLMNVMNGTSNLSEEVQNTVKTVLNGNAIDTSNSDKYLYLSLNPNANPTYTVNGYAADLTKPENIKQISDGATVTVSFASGLNNTTILPNGDSSKGIPSIKVWMREISTSSSLTVSNDDVLKYLTNLEEDVITLESNSETTFTPTETKAGEWTLLYVYTTSSSSSDSGTFSITIPAGIIDGDIYYMFGVTGCDMDKMYFAQKTPFVFQGSAVNTAPNVAITSPKSDDQQLNTANLVYEGYARLAADSSESAYVKEISAIFTYGEKGGNSSKSVELDYTITKDGDNYTVNKKTESGTTPVTTKDALQYYPVDVYENVTDENKVVTSKLVHSAGDFTFAVSNIDGLEEALASGKEYEYKLIVYAATTQSNSATRIVYIDTVKPEFDDDKTTIEDILGYDTVKGTWFGSEALDVYGVLNEKGSGVSKVDYWLDKETTEKITGRFVPSEKSDGTYSFGGTIAGFTEASAENPHYLRFKAYDNSGNESETKGFAIKVDRTAPVVTPKYYVMGSHEEEISGSVLTNNKNEVVVYGLVSDPASGLKSIKIPNATVTYATAETTETTTATDGTTETTDIDTNLEWFKKIDENKEFNNYDSSKDATKYTAWKAVFESGKISSGNVKYTTTDIAGNTKEDTVLSFTVDETPPEVTLNTPVDADSSTTKIDVNQVISLKGSAGDNRQLDESSVYLEYTTTNPAESTTKWTKLDSSNAGEKYEASSGSSFTVSGFDTKKFTNLSTIYVRAAASDEAENEGHSDYITLYVNQDSDRPVINITSLDESGSDVIISSQSVMGTISDDDGIKSFKYFDATKEGANESNDSDWTDITVSSGSWKIENLDKGSHSLKFKVEDTAGGTFITGDASGTDPIVLKPFISYGKVEKTSNDNPTVFAIDLSAPTINGLYIAATSENVAPSATDDNGKLLETLSDSWIKKNKGNASFGASSKYMSILISANEDVSVHSTAAEDISVKIGSVDLPTDTKIERTPADTLSGDFVYIIGPVDVTALKDSSDNALEGTITVSVTVKDASTRESSDTQNIYIDEGAPEVSITSPNANAGTAATGKTNGVSTTTEAITGKYTIKGRVADTSGIASFKYLIPTQAQISNIKLMTSSSDFTGWTSVKSVGSGTESGSAIENYENKSLSSQWAITFDSSLFEKPTAENGETAAESLVYYATAKDSSGSLIYATKKSDSTTGEVYVPLYFYVEDTTGNFEIVENEILVDPKGGIPTVEITSHEEKDGSIPKTGTTVSLMGTATDDEKVASVKVTKVEYATDDTVTEETKWTALTAAQLARTADKPVVTKGTVDSTSGIITAEGTTSWKASVNVQNITGASATIKALRFTVESYDENGTSSAKEYPSGTSSTCTIRIYVDAGNPALQSPSIVGFTSAPTDVTATPDWEKSYTAGMYFSGNAKTASGTAITNWYLKTVVTDDTSVVDVALSTQTGGDYINAMTDFGSSESAADVIASGAGSQTYTALIPISVASEGKVYATLTMNDGQHTDVTSSFTFNIDNTAPTVYGTDGKALASTDVSKLRLTSLGKTVDDENVVENSDGSYTFGDELTESGSGLAYVAFYFEKAANSKNSTNRVYSPMYKDSNKTTVVSTSSTTPNDGEVYINSEGLPALYKSSGLTFGTSTDGYSTVSFSGLGSNYNINNKNWCASATSFGLVKINGSYHKITAISGDTATLEDTVTASTSATAEFIYAMLVDHEVTEGFDSTSDTLVSNDDGDGLVEMVKRSGTTYKWSASVYSDNIPDGPVQIHIVAFDEAGNSTHGYVSTSIQNNRPRIARLYLATDLNGNGKFDYYNESATAGVLSLDDEKATGNGTEFGELVFYSALDSEGKVQGNAVLSTNACRFVASGDTLVMPEFVGGNGELKYAMEVGENDTAASTVGKTTAETSALKSLYTTAAELNLEDEKDSEGNVITTGTVAQLLANHTKVDATTRVISDSGTNSGSYKGLILSKSDLTKYESWVGNTKSYKYFAFTFWDSTDETTPGTDSLYALLKVPLIVNVIDDVPPTASIKPFWWNSKDDSSFVYNDDGEAQGHIALETSTKPIPGVSGKIYIDGTAEDETRLSKIYVKEPSGAEYLIAEYANGAWTVPEAISATSDTASKAKWTLDRNSVEITTVRKPSQSGHKVEFRVAVDMTAYGVEKSSDTKPLAIEAYAKDDSSQTSGSNTSASSTTQTAAGSYDADESKWTPYYKVDFVPYIKSIYTTSIGSANRSRLGKFPVRAGEQMTIEGMNFASGATYTVSFYKSNTDGTPDTTVAETIADANVTKVSDGVIKVTAPNYSRWVTVTVDGVPTPNNDVTTVNDVPGCDIESGYVSGSYKLDGTKYTDNGLAKSNKNGTDFWTNNRYIDAWKVNTTFDGSINPHSGVVKKIHKEDTIPNSTGTGTGYVGLKKKGALIEPTTDMTNQYMGFISSDDMRVYIYQNTTQNVAMSPTKDVSLFSAYVDAVDMVVLGGLPYYVLQTNHVGNVNANVWGPGLFISREGFAYDKDTYEGDGKTPSSATYPWIIEQQGSTNSAMGRNSSDGYDSILYQFKNPRIAGWHTNSPGDDDKTEYYTGKYRTQTDYIYVSYYDSYAKCLKFAAFRSGRDVDTGTNRISNLSNEGAELQWGGGNAGDHELVAEVRSANGNMTTGATVVAGNDTTQNNPTTFNEKAGEWSDIVVDATSGSPVPVIVYYNETNKCLEVAQGNSKFPKSKNYVDSTNTTAADSSLSGADAWTKTLEIRPTGSSADFGRYVSAAIDSSGNLHVAAQDATHSTLYYLYLKKDGTSYSVEKSVLLDAASGAGLWTDIELTNPSGTNLAEIKPVISYINSSYTGTTQGIKIAYVSGGSKDDIEFDATTDPAVWSAGNQRTSVMADVYEGAGTTSKAKIGVGFNSDMLAIDFLRGEK